MESLREAIQQALQSDRPSRPPLAQPKACDIMRTRFITFHPSDSVQKAVRVMLRKKISGGPVIDGMGHLVGMISEVDCLRVLAGAAFHEDGFGDSKIVEHLMTPRDRLKTIPPETNIYDLAHDFLYNGLRRLPVVRGSRLVGYISRTDVLHYLAAKLI